MTNSISVITTYILLLLLSIITRIILSLVLIALILKILRSSVLTRRNRFDLRIDTYRCCFIIRSISIRHVISKNILLSMRTFNVWILSIVFVWLTTAVICIGIWIWVEWMSIRLCWINAFHPRMLTLFISVRVLIIWINFFLYFIHIVSLNLIP